jgi:hypothetical protein
MSVNLGGVASGADENAADGDGLGVFVAPVSGVGEIEGRVPASVADGDWARAMPWQVRKTTVEAIVFTTSHWAGPLFCRFRRDRKNRLAKACWPRN